MADRKAKFAILSYFQKGYSKVTGGETLVMNKYSAQWDADALLESYDVDTLKAMIDRYLTLVDHPSWKGFCRDAERVREGMVLDEQDKRWREIMKEQLKVWMND